MSDSISKIFGALSDPTRRAMLAQIALGEASVSELAAPYRISLPAASRHIAVLEAAGLLSKHKAGRVVSCRMNGSRLRTAMEWMSRYERFWSEQLDSLDDYLKSEDS